MDLEKPPTSPSTEVSQEDMAGIFSGRNPRKGTSSSSSGTSENTPLLNGSQEGPCYAYSYGSRAENITDSISTTASCDENEEKRISFKNLMNGIKMSVLVGVMIFCLVALSLDNVQRGNWITVAVTKDKPAHINITNNSQFNRRVFHVKVKGPFLSERYHGLSNDMVQLTIIKHYSNGTIERETRTWTILVSSEKYDDQDLVLAEKIFSIENYPDTDSIYQLVATSNVEENYITMSICASLGSEIAVNQIIMAIGVLAGFYLLLIFDLVHKTLAAMIGATTAIACLALVGELPSLEKIFSWIDVEVLSLLLGMMVMFSILCETGFFDFSAVLIYKCSQGRTWPIIIGLCLTTTLLSSVLESVVVIILMSAITVRLCEAMNIDPKHLLIVLVIFANIGAAATPLGDPQNTIVTLNKKVQKAGITFGNFTLHMFPAAILSFAASFLIIRIIYRDITSLRFSEPLEVVEIKQEIVVWKKTHDSLSGYSRDEDTVREVLKRKITILETLLRKKLYDYKISEEDYKNNLRELSNTFQVKNKPLLNKSAIVIGIVMLLFFLENVPALNLNVGWIAMLGAICLLILGDFDRLESIFSRVEWATLLLVASLFVLIKALTKLKLVFCIAQLVENAINSVPDSQQLLVAIIILLWISALSSSLIGNAALTTVMVNSVTNLADSDGSGLPLKPLVYAISLGACLGGNGTLVGALTNIVAAGLSEQHGYKFSFKAFFIIGFPVMMLTTLIATAYLLICHVALGWND